MRLALNIDAPGIIQLLQAHAPELDIVPAGAPPPELKDVEALLTPAGGRSDLAALLAHCPQLKWIHILGTGVDNFPLELAENRLITCLYTKRMI